LASGLLTVASGLLTAKSFPWLQLLPTQLVCCLHKHLSQQWFLFFPVLNPCRSVISFIAFIHIVCCLKFTYVKPCKWVLLSFWQCFKTNVIAIVIVVTFNVIIIVIDYTAILFIRNRLHLCCYRPMSAGVPTFLKSNKIVVWSNSKTLKGTWVLKWKTNFVVDFFVMLKNYICIITDNIKIRKNEISGMLKRSLFSSQHLVI